MNVHEKVRSLSEDELSLLWGIINVIQPKILSATIDVSIFSSIKYSHLHKRLQYAEQHIKPEFKDIYQSLVSKLK